MTIAISVDDAAVSGRVSVGLAKAPSGIKGLDDVMGGGLPRGRTTIIAGGAGSGKTLMGVEFLVHGALDYGEPGVLFAFEESTADLSANVASLGYDLDRLQAEGLMTIDGETGACDLNGLLIRLDSAVEAIGAKRVVLDSIEVLLAAIDDETRVRAELRTLFLWLKARGLTAVVTGEKGEGLITRLGIEEYVSDCVITLDHRVHAQISTRRLRVVKYRGSLHGTDEFPFLITDQGIVVLPVTSAHLDYEASSERISTGVGRLDHMLGGGVFRGSSVLVSGEAGTGKTTLAARMLQTSCERGERALFVSFEESPAQLARNMTSVGLDLNQWVDQGLLRVWAARPSAYGLETHLASLQHMVDDFNPSMVVLDAIGSLAKNGVAGEVMSLITREIDLLKSRCITAVMTELNRSSEESSDLNATSLMDIWVRMRNIEVNGEFIRLLCVRKSRGSAHSNQVREFVINDTGLELLDVSVGPDGAVHGSARLVVDAASRDAAVRRTDDFKRRRDDLARRRREVDAQADALRQALDDEVAEVEHLEAEGVRHTAVTETDEDAMGAHRWADAEPNPVGSNEPEVVESVLQPV